MLTSSQLLSTGARGFPFRVPSSSPCPLGMGFPPIVWALYGMTGSTLECTSQLPRLRVVHFRKEWSPMSSCKAVQYVPVGPFHDEAQGCCSTRVKVLSMDWLAVVAPPLLYGRRPGQPSSSSLARRACVHFVFVFWVFLNYGSAPGPFGDRGGTPR